MRSFAHSVYLGFYGKKAPLLCIILHLEWRDLYICLEVEYCVHKFLLNMCIQVTFQRICLHVVFNANYHELLWVLYRFYGYIPRARGQCFIVKALIHWGFSLKLLTTFQLWNFKGFSLDPFHVAGTDVFCHFY